MINDEKFAMLVEAKGWEWVLENIDPDQLVNAALAEALIDAQESFVILKSMSPVSTDFENVDEDWLEGLDDSVDPDELWDSTEEGDW